MSRVNGKNHTITHQSLIALINLSFRQTLKFALKKNAPSTTSDMQLHHPRILFILNRDYKSSCSEPNPKSRRRSRWWRFRWRIVGSVSITHVSRMHYANSHSCPQLLSFTLFVLGWRRSIDVSRKFYGFVLFALFSDVTYSYGQILYISIT